MKHILGPDSRSTLTAVQEGDSQPNAIDLRVDKVFKVNDGLFEVSNEHKKHRGSIEIKPDLEGYFNLPIGHYEVVMENIISVGQGEAGWVITRSTLNRNGLFLTSGLYDSGYHGAMAGMLHVTIGQARIKKGTRIGQYLSFEAESLSMYDGDYGINKEHDKKYGVKE
jgi:deoxycytidine triphosphate deaminase